MNGHDGYYNLILLAIVDLILEPGIKVKGDVLEFLLAGNSNILDDQILVIVVNPVSDALYGNSLAGSIVLQTLRRSNFRQDKKKDNEACHYSC
jgi:hypothetical protein